MPTISPTANQVVLDPKTSQFNTPELVQALAKAIELTRTNANAKLADFAKFLAGETVESDLRAKSFWQEKVGDWRKLDEPLRVAIGQAYYPGEIVTADSYKEHYYQSEGNKLPLCSYRAFERAVVKDPFDRTVLRNIGAFRAAHYKISGLIHYHYYHFKLTYIPSSRDIYSSWNASEIMRDYRKGLLLAQKAIPVALDALAGQVEQLQQIHSSPIYARAKDPAGRVGQRAEVEATRETSATADQITLETPRK